MSYSISISGHTEAASNEEIADEGRKLVKALPGVITATLYTGTETIDLTKDAAPAAETPAEGTST